MSKRIFILLLSAAWAAASGLSPDRIAAQAPQAIALGGVVTSREEGPMEGVVVSARRDGANFTVSVVSDEKGNYSFPRANLAPGKYAVTIRAVGYDLVAPATAEVTAGRIAKANLALVKSKDLASQMSSLEWVTSAPGDAAIKDKLMYQVVSCNYCHALERVMKSQHSAEEFVDVITRMQKYYTDGSAVGREKRGRGQIGPPDQVAAADTNPNWGREPLSVPKKELAEYLSTINQSGGKTNWPFELKTLPRPKGKSTRVIITQYDMPRADTVPHDVDLDSAGTPWYTDESRMFFGQLNPKTGIFTEYPLPPVPPGDLPGARDIQVDRDDNVWFPRRIANTAVVMTKYNPKTQELKTLEGAGLQFLALGPEGKIWAGWSRIDPRSMKVEASYAGWENRRTFRRGRIASTSI